VASTHHKSIECGMKIVSDRIMQIIIINLNNYIIVIISRPY